MLGRASSRNALMGGQETAVTHYRLIVKHGALTLRTSSLIVLLCIN